MREKLRSATRPGPILLGLMLAALPLAGCRPEPLEISQPWARPVPSGGNSAVYFLIRNFSSNPIELIGVESGIAERVELHRSMMENDVMKMVEQEAIRIPAKGEVRFQPGGYHVMLIGVKEDLLTGDTIQLALQFEGLADLVLPVPVQEE